MIGNAVKSIELSHIDSGTFTGNYDPMIGGGIEHACTSISIYNETKGTDVLVSFDGINDHLFIKHGNKISIYFQCNSSPQGFIARLKKGTGVYVKGTLGIGYIYLAAYYN